MMNQNLVNELEFLKQEIQKYKTLFNVDVNEVNNNLENFDYADLIQRLKQRIEELEDHVQEIKQKEEEIDGLSMNKIMSFLSQMSLNLFPVVHENRSKK